MENAEAVTDIQRKATPWLVRAAAGIAILTVPGTLLAASVTLVPTGSLPKGTDNIALTFGEQQVVIHEGSLPVEGKKLSTNEIDASQLYLVKDRRAIPARVGYKSLFVHCGTHVAVVENLGPFLQYEYQQAKNKHHKDELWFQQITASQIVTQSPTGARVAPDPAVLAALDDLDAASFGSLLQTLSEAFPTRYACSPGEANAANAISNYLNSLGLDVRTVGYNSFCGNNGVSVLGIKPGTTRPNDVYLVGAHYDSTSEIPNSVAPGCNDNGSGTAAVMELARVYSQLDSEATIVFACWGGEEIGLLGSSQLVDQLTQNGNISRVKAFINMDMISYFKDTYGVLIEGSNDTPEQQAFIQDMASLAQTYTTLSIQTSTQPFGSDHVPFLDAGVPGALLIEIDWFQYPFYHESGDVFVHQDVNYGFEFVTLTGAFLSTYAGVE